MEDELAVFTTSLDNTVSTLTNTQRRLDSANLELATTARKLLPGSPGYSVANGGRGPARSTSSSPPGASSFRLNGHGTSYAYTNGRDVGSNSSVDKVID